MPIATFGEYMKQDRKTTDFTRNGECTQCGRCCSNYLPVSDREKRIIRKYIVKHGIAEKRHIVPTSEPYADWTCPFLDDSKPGQKCAIYPARPAICRAFNCHKTIEDWTQEDTDMLREKHSTTDMRATFFPGGQSENRND